MIRFATYACYLLRTGGLVILVPILAVAAVLQPSLPINIFSYPMGSVVFQMLRNSLINLPALFYYLSKLFIYFGNYIMWLLHIKLVCIATVEKIIGSLCITLIIANLHAKVFKTELFDKSDSIFYRQIQVLAGMFNEIERIQLVSILASVGTAQVVAACRLLGSSQSRSLNTNLLADKASQYLVDGFHLIILMNTSIVINFTFGYCSQMNEASRKFLAKLKSSVRINKNSSSKRMIKSCAEVRVVFGENNYIEKLTPVVYQMFLVERIVELLLLNRKRDWD